MSFYPARGLHIHFLGHPSILNDGETENDLEMVITNNNFDISGEDADSSMIKFTNQSPIYLYFVVSPEEASETEFKRPWGICTAKQIAEAQLEVTSDSHKDCFDAAEALKAGESDQALANSLAGWKLTPKKDFSLEIGEAIQLKLSTLRTSLPSGPTTAYCKIELPIGDKDGDKAPSFSTTFGPVMKGIMVQRGEKIGIGTDSPKVSLEVKGGIRAKSGEPDSSDDKDKGFFFTAKGDKDSGIASKEDGHLGVYLNETELLGLKRPDGEDTANAKLTGSLEVTKQIQISGGGILVKGGEPGGKNINNTGYFFSKTTGDNDSGMSSKEDGHVGFYTNKIEALTLKHDWGDEGTASVPEATFDANLTLKKDLSLEGKVTSDLELDGDMTLKNLTVSESISGDLDIGGKLTFGGKPAVVSEIVDDDDDSGNLQTSISDIDYYAFIGGFELNFGIEEDEEADSVPEFKIVTMDSEKKIEKKLNSWVAQQFEPKPTDEAKKTKETELKETYGGVWYVDYRLPADDDTDIHSVKITVVGIHKNMVEHLKTED